MSNFIVRVELQKPQAGDYDVLHGAMEKAGFSRTIKSGEGRVYQLPTATYSAITDKSIETVRDVANTAAKTTGRNVWVLVTEGHSSWIGLDLV